jgi:carboxyl-terminal processing protease
VSSIKRYFIPLILFVSVTWFAFTPGDKYFEVLKNLDIFTSMFKEVNALYVDEVDPEKLVKAGIDAMLESLDPYTTYIPEEDVEEFKSMTTGQYAGIGASLGKVKNRILITMPFENFAAWKAGMKVGDEILKVNGIGVKGKDLDVVSNLLKGPVNSKIEVEVKRHGNVEPLKFSFTRERIKIFNVPYYGTVENKIGYIRLDDFTVGAGKEVADAVVKLKNSGAEKLILDLRNNPGGLLNEAVNVVNIFIPGDRTVVETRSRLAEWNKEYKTSGNPVDIQIPLVILVNESSASASEIVAGAIQDYDRGILVGRKTYGKGLVQTTRTLPYNSQLKITTARYYTPSGRCIQSVDYTKKDASGGGTIIPDSLREAYKTSNGRTVFDGNGLQPDVFVEVGQPVPVLKELKEEGLLFDYATKWVHEHNAEEGFIKGEKEFNMFAQWLSDKEFKYHTSVERTLLKLKESAEEEAYLQDLQVHIQSLEWAIQKDKKNDLNKYKDDILELLEQEIAIRRALLPGQITASFDDDPDILKAVQLLKEKDAFSQILSRN